MKKILLLDKDYPSDNNLYGDVFVHNRVKEYKKYVEIRAISFFRNQNDYEYEGIYVKHLNNIREIIEECKIYKPDAIFIHFYESSLFPLIQSIDVPIIIWVHGYEALGWYRRLFNYHAHYLIRYLHHIAYTNAIQMKNFHQLIKFSNSTNKVHFVFVSKWMKKITETDAFIKTNNFSIIPNPINSNIFNFKEKELVLRKKILLLRPFSSKKYANDLAIEAILKLRRKKYFKELEFSIYGEGILFDELTKPLLDLNNVGLNKFFVPNIKLPDLFHNYGILLIPTRQDAQGVTMCEGMACGLVPITSNNSAIPEFVEHNYSGFLTKDVDQIVESIDFLYNNPSEFNKLSLNASKNILDKGRIEKIIRKELQLIGI